PRLPFLSQRRRERRDGQRQREQEIREGEEEADGRRTHRQAPGRQESPQAHTQLVRRAAEANSLKRGVKEVVKSVRRGHKGLCVIAGNISPIDVITHVPILLEEADIPYIYVPSEEVCWDHLPFFVFVKPDY
ncbi:unnamed protein product, partial [Musa textilis]